MSWSRYFKKIASVFCTLAGLATATPTLESQDFDLKGMLRKQQSIREIRAMHALHLITATIRCYC
jgi:hypothetical protein